MGVSLGATYSNPANQIDRTARRFGVQIDLGYFHLLEEVALHIFFSQSHLSFAKVKEYFVSANQTPETTI